MMKNRFNRYGLLKEMKIMGKTHSYLGFVSRFSIDHVRPTVIDSIRITNNMDRHTSIPLH